MPGLLWDAENANRHGVCTLGQRGHQGQVAEPHLVLTDVNRATGTSRVERSRCI